MLRLIDPCPNFCVVVVVPSEDRLTVPEPKRLVVTRCPLPRVMAPFPNFVVVNDSPFDDRVIQPSPNLLVV